MVTRRARRLDSSLDEPVKKVHSHYHTLVSNTAAGLMVLANAA